MAVVHLGHAEIRVTDLERSRWFFTEILGLYITEENDERVYFAPGRTGTITPSF